MKLDAFEKLIRKVVREEIDYALQREMKVLKEGLATQPTQQQRVVEQTDPLKEIEAYRNNLRAKMPPPNFNTKDNTLNTLLSETAAAPLQEYSLDIDGSTNHLVRDYSALMNAIEKKKEFRPGY